MQLDAILANCADQDKGRLLELVEPFTGLATGIKLWVAGPDSDTAHRARVKLADDLAEAADDDGMVSGLAREKCRRAALAAHVLRWDILEEGEAVPFSTQNVLRLLKVQWVEAQVDAFAADRRNFAPLERFTIPIVPPQEVEVTPGERVFVDEPEAR